MATYTKIGRIRPDYADVWDSARSYTALEMVKSADSYQAYIAKQDVPAGTPLTDEAYWGVVLDVSDVIAESVAATNRANTAAEQADAAREAIKGDFEELSERTDQLSEEIDIILSGEDIVTETPLTFEAGVMHGRAYGKPAASLDTGCNLVKITPELYDTLEFDASVYKFTFVGFLDDGTYATIGVWIQNSPISIASAMVSGDFNCVQFRRIDGQNIVADDLTSTGAKLIKTTSNSLAYKEDVEKIASAISNGEFDAGSIITDDLNNGVSGKTQMYVENAKNTPNSITGIVHTFKGGHDNQYQLAVTYNGEMFFRVMWGANNWGSWHRPYTFAGAIITDLNAAKIEKVHRYSAGAQNAPSSLEGDVITLQGGYDNMFQIAVDTNNVLHYRIMWGVDNWSTWKSYGDDNAFGFDVSPANLAFVPRIGIIGDSYASGEIYINDEAHDIYYQSWGQIMARTKGITVHNFSQGGMAAKSFMQGASHGLNKLLNTEKCNLYVIVLGINDKKTAADVGTINDIGTEVDTFCRWYSDIITSILAYNEHAKIIVVKGMNNATEDYVRINNAMQDIAEHFGLPTVAQYEEPYFVSDYFKNSLVSGHPTPSSYGGMANAMTKILERCIAENQLYFYDINYYDYISQS